jgi:hypothetical protein
VPTERELMPRSARMRTLLTLSSWVATILRGVLVAD